MTEDQRVAISGYIGGSEPINTFLRGQTNSSNYPLPKDIPRIKKQAKDISAALKNNPLQENVSAYKGITDKYLAMMFEQHGLKDALNTDGTVNHKWLRNNQKMMLDTLVGKTFHDKGYTSTTTETSFAKGWATQKSAMEIMERTKSKKKRAKILQTLNNHSANFYQIHSQPRFYRYFHLQILLEWTIYQSPPLGHFYNHIRMWYHHDQLSSRDHDISPL